MVTYHYHGKQIELKLNGTDNPSCPNCNRYNAMLWDRVCNNPSDDYVLKCRDCQAEVIVLHHASRASRIRHLPTASLELIAEDESLTETDRAVAEAELEPRDFDCAEQEARYGLSREDDSLPPLGSYST